MRRNWIQLAMFIFPMLVLSLACFWLAGEDLARQRLASTSTQAYTSPTTTSATGTPSVSPTASPQAASQLELTIVPYPTPGDSIIPWTELINPTKINAVQWAEYIGAIQANARQQIPISVSYPYTWTVSQPASHILSIQNEPPEAFPAYQGPFVKFEVLWLKEQPLANAALPEVRTVLVSGRKSILWENQWYGTFIIGALVEHRGTYYSVHGYISRVNDEQNEHYRNIVLYMISTLAFGE